MCWRKAWRLFWVATALLFDNINASRYHMIKSFADKETERLFHRRYSRYLPHDIQISAFRKLSGLDAAKFLNELRAPSSNHLEVLKGTGLWSIRINKQWRVCFKWENGNAFDVEIIDYH